MSIEGTQSFLIECNRGNSVIDANAPQDQNGKWTNKIDIQLKRGDKVSVEAMMIESTGAGNQTQTIEFTGENLVEGDNVLPYVDNKVVLEFGFYMSNTAAKCVSLPLCFGSHYLLADSTLGVNPGIHQTAPLNPVPGYRFP